MTPPTNSHDPAIDDWLLPATASRGSTSFPTTATTPPLTEPTSAIYIPSTQSEPVMSPPPELPSAPTAITIPDNTAPPSPTPQEPRISSPPEPSSPGIPEILGRGQRVKTPSVLLKNYVTHSAHVDNKPSLSLPTTDQCLLRTSSGITPYPISSYLSDHVFSDGHRAFMAAIVTSAVPRSYKEAAQQKVWCDAISKEVNAFEDTDTWDVTDLPPGRKALGNMWLFSDKYDADGNHLLHKARLVVLGNNQIEGDDFNETFAPVAKLTTVRFILKVAAVKNWLVHQMDVSNAFLHGDLDEEIYMKLPQGYKSADPNKVCRLKKSLYGLRQAPRCWYAKLTNALLRFGFSHDYADQSLFSKVRGSICIHILVYVDDFIIACNDTQALQDFKDYLHKCFRMKDLGKLKYFLGLEVARSNSGFYLSQRKYALDIIAETGLLASKPSPVPMELNHKLAQAEGPLANVQQYRRLVGRLIYLTNTRPDLAYSVHILAQFMQKPLLPHWDAAIRVVRYLKGSPGQGIFFKADDQLRISAFCDADWSGCPLSRRSLSAYIVFLGDSPVSWRTKKQDAVALSSAEAEYRAMSDTVKELKWMKGLFLSFGLSHPDPMRLFCDSKSALYIASNPVFHERTKHIERNCHHVRDALKAKLIATEHVSSRNQLADILTKSLPRPLFEELLSKLAVRNLTLPT